MTRVTTGDSIPARKQEACMKQIFTTDKAPRPKGPYSQAVLHNGLIYVSGMGPVDAQTDRIIRGTIEEETKAALENVKIILEHAGSGMKDVLKVSCFLSDMNDFERFNNVYKNYFSSEPPARTTIQAGRLPMDIKVEIDCIAAME